MTGDIHGLGSAITFRSFTRRSVTKLSICEVFISTFAKFTAKHRHFWGRDFVILFSRELLFAKMSTPFRQFAKYSQKLREILSSKKIS
jgi:hypothetical protein